MSENELDIELNEPLVPVEEYLAAVFTSEHSRRATR